MQIEAAVLSNNIGQIAAGLQAKAEQIVMKTAADIEADAKVRAPVRTGALRNSIQHRQTGPGEAEVSVGVDYAAFQEYGTIHQPAQPYLTPAAEAARPAFEAAMAKLVEG